MSDRFLVRPPDPALPTVRDDLVQRVQNAVGSLGAEVVEVGSTAVDGVVGKGDLDLLVRAPADRFEAVRTALDALLPRNPDQLSTDIYQGYTDPAAPIDAAVQLTVRDGPHDDFLPFLEALQHPRTRAQYNALKRAWNGRPMDAYRTAKSAFIAGVLNGLPPIPDRCDVAVVGGSLAGVATALFLAREGVDVVLFESQRFVGDSISGRGLGPVEHNVVEHPHRTVRALGPERSRHLYALTALNRDTLDAEGLFDRCGALWVATLGEEALDIGKSVEAVRDYDVRAEAWTRDQVEARIGQPLGPGLYLPDDGKIDAFGALHTLLQRAIDAGVHVALGAEATVGDGDPITLRARGTNIQAEMVVYAAGRGNAALDPRLATSLTPVRDQALLTEPIDFPDPGFGRAGQGWTAWCRHVSGGLLVSGSRWGTPHMEAGETDATALQPAIQAHLEGFLRRSLRCEAAITDRFAFGFTTSRDGLPIIGPLPGQPRRIVLAGFGPNPASFAVGAARMVADGLMGGDADGPTPWLVSSRRLVRWRHGD
jgi:glycine/D-amino acid oxidase-like deaminating enzyme/GrpB-like predicted nucleotidyltransferase (UPF0157 family)